MPIAPDSFQFVRELVMRESAIQLEPGKEYLVEARLAPVARKAGHQNVDSLVSAMKKAPTREMSQVVVEALTTNETSFFRDNEPFKVLAKTILPDLAQQRAAAKKIRMWSAACSSGQEVYSMGIVAKECKETQGFTFEYLATDLSAEMVRRAAAGKFNQLEMNRGMPAPYLVKYFSRQGVDWVASEELRSAVRAQELNLNKPFPALGRFDVVFLRNVLIYFDVPTKKAVLGRIAQAMAPDGYLVLGTAESTHGIDDGWERHPMGKTTIFRPRGAQR